MGYSAGGHKRVGYDLVCKQHNNNIDWTLWVHVRFLSLLVFQPPPLNSTIFSSGFGMSHPQRHQDTEDATILVSQSGPNQSKGLRLGASQIFLWLHWVVLSQNPQTFTPNTSSFWVRKLEMEAHVATLKLQHDTQSSADGLDQRLLEVSWAETLTVLHFMSS